MSGRYGLDDAVSVLLPVTGKASSRRGARVRLLALHTAEGARTVESLASWFRRPNVRASSQVGIDDRHVSRMVPERDSAWTAGPANPHATQAELCGFAAWSRAEWLAHPGMLERTARWLAAASIYHGIPLTRLPRNQVRSGTGVVVHYDITVGWPTGSHTDCGQAFYGVLDDVVLPRARQIAASGTHAAGAPTAPVKSWEDDLMASIHDPVTKDPHGGDHDVSVVDLLRDAAVSARRSADAAERAAAAAERSAEHAASADAALTTPLTSAIDQSKHPLSTFVVQTARRAHETLELVKTLSGGPR